MAEIMSLFVFCIESLRAVELSVVDKFSQAIPSFDVDLLSGWGQVNVLDVTSGPIKVYIIFLVEDVVVIEGRKHEHRVVEKAGGCSCENRLDENGTHYNCVHERMEQKCGAWQVEVLLVKIVASDWVNLAVSWVVYEVELGWWSYDSEVS